MKERTSITNKVVKISEKIPEKPRIPRVVKIPECLKKHIKKDGNKGN